MFIQVLIFYGSHNLALIAFQQYLLPLPLLNKLLLSPTWASQAAQQQRICLPMQGRFDAWLEKVPWRKKWRPISVFLPEKSQGQRRLVGYSWTQLTGWKTTIIPHLIFVHIAPSAGGFFSTFFPDSFWSIMIVFWSHSLPFSSLSQLPFWC